MRKQDSPDFLAVDSLLPSHLHLLPSSPPPPLTDLRPGSSLLFSVEADTEVTLPPGWDQKLEVQVSFRDSGGEEKLIRMMKKTDEGKCLVNFETSEAGIYKVTATLYDNHITNSPFLVEVDEVNQSKMAKAGKKRSGSRGLCEMTEEDLMTIEWQQGKTLPAALKSLAKFLASIDIVEVVEKEPTKTVVFKIAEKKKFIKVLKIYSRNETNSFDKLHSATPRLVLSPSKSNGMFGLTVIKKKDDLEFVRKLKAKYPIARIEEKSHVKIIWLPSKLDYFKALIDKSLNVNFLPSSQNYLDVKNPTVVTKDMSEDKQVLTPVESSPFMVTEKAIFGFLWRSLGEAFQIKEEQVISRQLTEFIKNAKYSKITSGDEGLVFHFATKEDLNAMVAQYCPEFVDEPDKLATLSRKFTIIPSRGQYGIFSATPINIQDFLPIAECKLYYSTLWFSTKMDLIKALRDEKISRLYSALYIDCRNILILQAISLLRFVPPLLPQRSRTESAGSNPGFNTLCISYDEEQDAGLPARLQEDLSWYDVPLSIKPFQPGTLKIQMKVEKVAIAAFLGLKLKYPGLEIDKTGSSCVEIWEIFLNFVIR